LIGAILGHSYSCFTGFRGGKGVATGAGGFFVLFPVGALVALGAFVVTAALTRYISLASMVAAVSLPLSAHYLHESTFLTGVTIVIALFIVWRHRSNLARLRAGTENKVGQPKPSAGGETP
jgi:glycerol-3-phosphate acyltransferase PlsY